MEPRPTGTDAITSGQIKREQRFSRDRAGDLNGQRSVETQLFAELWVYPEQLARIPMVRPEHFSDKRVRRLFRGLKSLEARGEPLEFHSLNHELERTKQWAADDPEFLFDLAKIVATSAHIEAHAQQVVENCRKRELQGLLGQAVDSLERAGSSPDEVLGQLRRDFEDLEASTSSSLRFPEHLDGLHLYTSEIRPRLNIVEGGLLRPRHYSMIYGQPGKGKSYLLEQLVVSVATGRPWLGLEVVQGRVGVITLEEDREEVQARLKAICAHYSLAEGDIQECLINIRYLTVDELADGLDIERDRDKVVAWIQEYKLDVVVLDPISDAHTRPEVDNKAMKYITDTLNGICRQTDVAIAISHHTRKSSTSGRGKDDPLDAARGARLMQSCGGAALYLTEHLGTLCIQFAKIRKGGAREHLYLKRIPEGEAGEGCLELTDAPRDSKAQGEANREKVVAIVREAAGERLTLDVVTERYRARHPGEELKERTIRKHLNEASSAPDPSLERHEDDKPFTWSCRLAKVTSLEERRRKDTTLHEGDEK